MNISLADWESQFKAITEKYINSINWETVIFNEGDIAQIADYLQLEAYQDIYGGEDFNPSISDWDCYDDSCDSRADFQIDMEERWNKAQESRVEND